MEYDDGFTNKYKILWNMMMAIETNAKYYGI